MTSQIITGDCLTHLRTGKLTGVDLIATDPPYNIGVDYGDGGAGDSRPVADYYRWLSNVLYECTQVLRPGGVLAIILSVERAYWLGSLIDRTNLSRLTTVAWHESFGQHNSAETNLSQCWRPITVFFRMGDKPTFNPDAIRWLSDRQRKYHDARANPKGKVLTNVWAVEPDKIEDCGGALWSVRRECGTFRSRVPGVPTQIPLEIMRRIILLWSRPGDLVFDPFVGSGTTGVAAVRNGRRFVGCEINSAYAQIAEERISDGQGQQETAVIGVA